MKNNVVIEITYYVSDLRIIGVIFNRGNNRTDDEEFFEQEIIHRALLRYRGFTNLFSINLRRFWIGIISFVGGFYGICLSYGTRRTKRRIFNPIK
ncbi:hypothetical protein BCM0100_1991 [Bacillus cereus]|nr:hypothetical protein BCM0100_1991 [Bacillus cereus]BCC52680.1 hypothetical protein BCJMU07_2030 [Bacillus cereus]BCC76385.1 hypothetical protein BCJMU62_2076 [Bacillus cereus]